MDKNQEIGELLKISRPRPDFTTPLGMAVLLREMAKRNDWAEFLSKLSCNAGVDEFIKTFLLDKTGILRDIALNFLKSRKPDPFVFSVESNGVLGIGVNVTEMMKQFPDTQMMVVSRNRYASFNRLLTSDEIRQVVENWEEEINWGIRS